MMHCFPSRAPPLPPFHHPATLRPFHCLTPTHPSLKCSSVSNTSTFSIRFLGCQEGVVDKTSAPSVSSISRILRGGKRDDDPRKDHSIDGILGESYGLVSTSVLFCVPSTWSCVPLTITISSSRCSFTLLLCITIKIMSRPLAVLSLSILPFVLWFCSDQIRRKTHEYPGRASADFR